MIIKKPRAPRSVTAVIDIYDLTSISSSSPYGLSNWPFDELNCANLHVYVIYKVCSAVKVWELYRIVNIDVNVNVRWGTVVNLTDNHQV